MAKTSKNNNIDILIIYYINYNEDNNNNVTLQGFINNNVNPVGGIIES